MPPPALQQQHRNAPAKLFSRATYDWVRGASGRGETSKASHLPQEVGPTNL